MQLAWADAVRRYTNRPVLILAPIAVAPQTVREADVMGIPCTIARDDADVMDDRVNVCNYDRLHRLRADRFAGVVLDESSILKNLTGKVRTSLIETFKSHPWRLACTATPSPNDFDELGNHAEFLGVMTVSSMLARFFINDLSDTGTWRLKGYAEGAFWDWCASWAVAVRTPADLTGPNGQPYDGSRYVLPPLDIRHEVVGVDNVARQEQTGELFAGGALSATALHRELRATATDRAARVAELVNAEPDEPWVIWCHTDYEADAVRAVLPDVVEVRGSHTPEQKESRIADFSEGRTRRLLTKPSICGFGLNWQHCARMAFVGLSYSYEALYQALRRSYRFGQTRTVVAYLIAAESEGAVRDALKEKEASHLEMQRRMVGSMGKNQGAMIAPTIAEGGTGTVADGEGWTLTNGDCVETFRAMPDNSVDFSIYSPPFANLYVYSDDPRDMGNSADDDEFFRHYEFLLADMHRVTRPGRLMAVHVSQLPSFKWKHGVSGLRDFRGDVIRAAERAGWVYHSEVCIWKDPVTEMQRTKAHGLLYKTIRTNASFSRVGMPDYLVVFRKWADPAVEVPVTHDPNEFTLDLWQKVASPVWFDVDQTRTLNVRQARDSQDEKHLCPLQLDVIERAITLWSNPGDLVASPFTGIGSEGVSALRLGRRFVGAELKPSYFKHACRNLTDATAQVDLFGSAA
jgi:DNA modification methylase